MVINLIATYIFFIVVSILTGKGESYRIIDPVLHSKAWHDLQWLERVGLFISGMAITLILGFGWLLVLNALLMGIVFFILYDGVINVEVFGRNFFYVSKTTKAWTEKFAYWWIKVPLLIIISVLNVILLRKLKEKQEKL